MTLTQKETSLLNDLKSQEQICIEKYGKYAETAHDPELKQLFTQLQSNEQKHLDTVNQILGGAEVQMPRLPRRCRQSSSARCQAARHRKRKTTPTFARTLWLWKSTCPRFITPQPSSFPLPPSAILSLIFKRKSRTTASSFITICPATICIKI